MNLRTQKKSSALSSLLPILWKVPVFSERLVARLFVTPLRRSATEEFPTTTIEETSHIVTGKTKLFVRSYGEGRPVFVVHGWGGDSRQMRAFVAPLVRRGYRALLVDLPAHGKSPGKQTNLLEARDALLALARHFGEPHGVIGHSFGAAAAALAHGSRMHASALVFVAPLPSLEAGIEQFALRAKVPHALVDRASRRIERSLNITRDDARILKVAERVRTPLLVVHDEGDRTIALRHSQTLTEVWSGSRLLLTNGLGHTRLLADATVTEAAANFLEAFEGTRRSDLSEVLGSFEA